MPVQTQDGDLKVLSMIFEARYDQGYRYLDHSGELMVRIREYDPSWAVTVVGPTLAQLTNKQHHLTCSVGIEKIDISTMERLSLSQGEKQSRLLGERAETLYNLAVEVLKCPRTIRVGARFQILAPADSLEEADRFVFKGMGSPLLDAIVEKSKAEPREARVGYVLDDPESKHRRLVQLTSVVTDQKPGDPPFLGFPGDPGSGGIMVDVDTYARPEDGHLAKASMFIQQNYLRSRDLAKGIFAWLLSRQK